MLNILTKIILCSTSLLLMATTNSKVAMQQPQDTLKTCPDSVTAIGTEQPCQKARTQKERCKAMPKSHAMAAVMADSMMLNHPLAHDSVWHNSISGSRVHLQRLAPYDSLIKRRPQPWKALAVDLSINASILAFDYFVQNRDYARISKHVLRRNFRNGFVFDNDSFSGNQFSHPYHGSMFYNAAREHGIGYGLSLVYPLIGSATWELMCETNPPALNDLLSTGIGGAAIGEVAHRASDLFFDNSKTGVRRVMREIIGCAFNPVRGFQRLFSGDMWRVSPMRGKRLEPEPYIFEVGTGVRHLSTHGSMRGGMVIPYMSFMLSYGEHFDTDRKSHPFDLFRVYMVANMASDQPTFGEFEIVGRIVNRNHKLSRGWMLDLGVYQALKYTDHYSDNGVQHPGEYALISEAVSFGAGAYLEKHTERYNIGDELILSFVPLGGSTADYFPHRRYNFCTGFSLRNNLALSLNRHLTVGHILYYALLGVPDGYTPEELEEIEKSGETPDTWGDKGCNSIFTLRSFIRVNIKKGLKCDLSYQTYHRRSWYKHYPSKNVNSYEIKLGLIYSL